MERFNQVARLLNALEEFPGGNPLEDDPAYTELKRQGYIHVPQIISITTTDEFHEFDDADFSPEAIKRRADEGYAQTMRALQGKELE